MRKARKRQKAGKYQQHRLVTGQHTRCLDNSGWLRATLARFRWSSTLGLQWPNGVGSQKSAELVTLWLCTCLLSLWNLGTDAIGYLGCEHRPDLLPDSGHG